MDKNDMLESLSTLNSSQYIAATTLDRPVQLSAGAGTGKTFTLTKRIAYAFSKNSGPQIVDTDKLLAITFTEKAAAELSHRVRRELQLFNNKKASDIDSAWISTTDAMCRRILLENSLLLGLNPKFEIIPNEDVNVIKKELLDAELNLIVSLPQTELLDYQKVIRELFYYGGKEFIETSVLQVLNELSNYPGTLEHSNNNESLLVNFGPKPKTFNELLNEALHALSGIQNTVKPDDEKLISFESMLNEFIQEISDSSNLSENYKLTKLLQIIIHENNYFNLGGKKKEYVNALRSVAFEILASFMQQHSMALYQIACNIQSKYNQFALNNGSYDFNQIANLTRKSLLESASVSEKFYHHFDVTLVDEFQDTNQLQMDIVKSIVGDDFYNLCTVGDEQQAIYGFRGSNVDIYRKHHEEMKNKDAATPSMNINYRSHQSILDFVNVVFGQHDIFGDSLIPLVAGREEPNPSLITDDQDRIFVYDCVANKAKSTVINAKAIAEKFANIRDTTTLTGGDMVILLARMTNSNIYKEALINEGFDCITQGGSAFYADSIEINVLIDLLKTLSFPHDDEALLSLAISPAIGLSEDDLFSIALNSNKNISIYAKLQHLMKTNKNCLNQSQIDFAKLLEQLFNALTSERVSDVILYFIEATNWDLDLLNQGDSGKIAYANILKFISLVKEREAQGDVSVSSLADYFTFMKENSQEKNASIESKDAVRIMTIHASKGLEFPVVAVADISTFMSNKDNIKIFTKPGEKPNISTNLASVEAKRIIGNYKLKDTFKIRNFSTSQPLANFMYNNREAVIESDKEEEFRKYYVAMTRAKEVLILGMHDVHGEKIKKNNYNPRAKILAPLMDNEKTVPEKKRVEIKEGTFVQYINNTNKLNEQSPDKEIKQTLDVEKSSKTLNIFPYEGKEYDVLNLIPDTFSYSSLSVHPAQFWLMRCLNLPKWLTEIILKDKGVEVSEYIDPDEKKDNIIVDHKKEENAFYDISATDFGTAFHEIAEQTLIDPNLLQDVINTNLLNEYNFDDSVIQRLINALENLSKSQIYSKIQSKKIKIPEHEFLIKLSDGQNSFNLTGSIDVLAWDNKDLAYVVDYKTGFEAVGEKQSFEHYRQQAQTYALACLEDGFKKVQCTFMRIEIGKITEFEFTQSERNAIKEEIIQRKNDFVSDVVKYSRSLKLD